MFGFYASESMTQLRDLCIQLQEELDKLYEAEKHEFNPELIPQVSLGCTSVAAYIEISEFTAWYSEGDSSDELQVAKLLEKWRDHCLKMSKPFSSVSWGPQHG